MADSSYVLYKVIIYLTLHYSKKELTIKSHAPYVVVVLCYMAVYVQLQVLDLILCIQDSKHTQNMTFMERYSHTCIETSTANIWCNRCDVHTHTVYLISAFN